MQTSITIWERWCARRQLKIFDASIGRTADCVEPPSPKHKAAHAGVKWRIASRQTRSVMERGTCQAVASRAVRERARRAAYRGVGDRAATLCESTGAQTATHIKSSTTTLEGKRGKGGKKARWKYWLAAPTQHNWNSQASLKFTSSIEYHQQYWNATIGIAIHWQHCNSPAPLKFTSSIKIHQQRRN